MYIKEIIESYRKGDPGTRMEMAMTYRDLRQEFETIDINHPARTETRRARPRTRGFMSHVLQMIRNCC